MEIRISLAIQSPTFIDEINEPEKWNSRELKALIDIQMNDGNFTSPKKRLGIDTQIILYTRNSNYDS